MSNRAHPTPTLELAFEAFGRRIGLALCDASLFDLIAMRLPPGWRQIEPVELDRTFRVEWQERNEGHDATRAVQITVDGTFTAWAPNTNLIMDSLESQIQMYVAEFANPHLFVHAGVVVWNGVAVLLPGRSMSGKSTLVAALVAAGATYFSDEYAVLDQHGRVEPYARMISMREGPFGPARRIHVRATEPKPLLANAPNDVALVLLTHYREGAEWQCDRLDHASAVMKLCQHTVAIQRRPADTLSILGKLTSNADVFLGVRGDLDSAVSWIRSFVFQDSINFGPG